MSIWPLKLGDMNQAAAILPFSTENSIQKCLNERKNHKMQQVTKYGNRSFNKQLAESYMLQWFSVISDLSSSILLVNFKLPSQMINKW